MPFLGVHSEKQRELSTCGGRGFYLCFCGVTHKLEVDLEATIAQAVSTPIASRI